MADYEVLMVGGFGGGGLVAGCLAGVVRTAVVGVLQNPFSEITGALEVFLPGSQVPRWKLIQQEALDARAVTRYRRHQIVTLPSQQRLASVRLLSDAVRRISILRLHFARIDAAPPGAVPPSA